MTEKTGITTRIKQALRLDDNDASSGRTGNLVKDGDVGRVSGGSGTRKVHPEGVGSSSMTGNTGELHTGGATTTHGTTTTQGTSANTTGIPVSAVSSGASGPADRTGLISSDEHWEKAQAATEEARRQAKLVEEGARSHRMAGEEYYRAEREWKQATHTVEEIETRIRGVNLDAKKAELARAKQAYEAERERIASLSRGADTARAQAAQIQGDAEAKGHELEAEAKESKLYADRLSALEAALVEARNMEVESRQRIAAQRQALESARLKHDHHRVERERLSKKLTGLKAELDQLRAREAEAQRALDNHRSEHSGLAEEIAGLEADAQRKAADAEAHRSQLDALSSQRSDLQSLLGHHREQVSALTKDTQQTMARAQAVADNAEAKAADLQQTQAQIAQTEQCVDASREALSAAAAESRPLHDQAKRTAGEVESQAQQASALQAELRAAKERVDLAQAKKEELWALAKQHGSAADHASDVHYVKHVAEPAGEDPSKMVHKSEHTESLAGKIKYGADRILHHQKDGTVENPPQVA